MERSNVKTPVHLWLIGILAVLWNAMGVFDYLATQLNLEFYMKMFSPEQLEYFHSFPAWAVAGWAIAVWGSLLASLGLLLRKAWAVWLFGIAILGMLASSVYNFLLSDGMAIMGQEALIFTGVIWVIALFLFFYARAMARRGILL